ATVGDRAARKPTQLHVVGAIAGEHRAGRGAFDLLRAAHDLGPGRRPARLHILVGTVVEDGPARGAENVLRAATHRGADRRAANLDIFDAAVEYRAACKPTGIDIVGGAAADARVERRADDLLDPVDHLGAERRAACVDILVGAALERG